MTLTVYQFLENVMPFAVRGFGLGGDGFESNRKEWSLQSSLVFYQLEDQAAHSRCAAHSNLAASQVAMSVHAEIMPRIVTLQVAAQ